MAIAAFAFFGIGYTMYSMYQQEQEWGYLPILLLLFGWTAKLLGLGESFGKSTKHWKLISLGTLSGVLLSIGFPPIPFILTLFVAFLPILYIEDYFYQKEGIHKWQVFKYSFHAFLVWNILTTYWVCNTAFIPGVVAITLNAVFMALPIMAYHQTRKILDSKFRFPAFISYWIAFEWVHLNWEISWPWLTLGNAFAEFHSWVQWYEFTGVFGGTLWILGLNVLFYKLWQLAISSQWNPKKIVPKIFLPLGLLLAPIALSLLMYYNYTEEGKTTEVVVIQPNYNPHYEKFRVPQTQQLERFIRLADTQVDDNTDFLIFPETSFRRVDAGRLEANPQIAQLKAYLKKYPKLSLITGISSYRVLTDEKQYTKATRTQIRGKDTLHFEAYNAAIQLQEGMPTPLYQKSILVPGAEFMPYHQYLFFLKPISDKLGGSLEGHATQKERETFANKDGIRSGTMICYESIFGNYSKGYIRNGAQFLNIITNDGWWDDTAGFRQHLRFASLRAIEYRRSIARSANTGSSAFINQRGDIQQATDYEVEAAIKQEIFLSEEGTFFSVWGDLIARIGLFLALLLVLNTIAKSYMVEKKQ